MLMTFTAPREVSIVHYPLGMVLWTLRVLIVSYISYAMSNDFSYLEIVVPTVLQTGWAEVTHHRNVMIL